MGAAGGSCHHRGSAGRSVAGLSRGRRRGAIASARHLPPGGSAGGGGSLARLDVRRGSVVAGRRDGFRPRPVRNALAEPGQARRQRARPARGTAGTRRPSSSRPRRRRSRPGHGWRRQDKSPRCWLQWSRFAAVGPWWGTELFPVRLHGGRAAAGHPYPRAIETIRDKASNRAVES